MEMQKGWPRMEEAKRSELQQIIDILQETMPCDIVILYGQYANGKMRSVRGGYELILVTEDNPPMQGYMLESKLKMFYPYSKRVETRIHIETASIHEINGADSSRWFYQHIRDEGIILYEKEGHKCQNIFTKTGFKSTRAYNAARKNYDHYFNVGSAFLMDAKQAWQDDHRVVAFIQLAYAARFLLWTVETVFYGNHNSGSDLATDYRRASHFSRELVTELRPRDANDQNFFYEIDAMRRIIQFNADFTLSTKKFNPYVKHIETLQRLVQKSCEAHLGYLALCKLKGIQPVKNRAEAAPKERMGIIAKIRKTGNRLFRRITG